MSASIECSPRLSGQPSCDGQGQSVRSDGKAGFRHRAQQARSWMHEAAFPLWSEQGITPEGGFWEALNLDGRPLVHPLSRVRVQARQTYVFALAATMGWQPRRALELVHMGLRTLQQACRREDGLYGGLVDLNSQTLADSRASLYDSAFALFAHAWAVRVGVGREALIAGQTLNQAIDNLLCRPDGSALFFSGLPTDSRVEQNPHMHLLEASLAWYETTGDRAMLARINGLVHLLENRFVDRNRGGLREVFAADWGPHAEDRFEAGHQYEWVWLLHECARVCNAPVSAMADVLYRKGRELSLANGRMYLSHSLNGEARQPVHRCWVLTEALKAQLALVDAGDSSAIAAVNACFDRLWADHIDGAVAGGWLDQLDASGSPIFDDMPASTGYHLHLAFAELLRIARVVDQ